MARTFLLIFLSLIANALVTLVLTSQSIAILHNQEISLLESLRVGLRRFWAFIGMSIVKWFIISAVSVVMMIGVGCLFFALAFLVSGLFSSGGGDAMGSEMAMVTGVLFGVVCLYLGILLLMSIPVVYLTRALGRRLAGPGSATLGPNRSVAPELGIDARSTLALFVVCGSPLSLLFCALCYHYGVGPRRRGGCLYVFADG